ncbi:MAG TPA: tetratricopeptide repeat protein, partial [Vicinamibacterales bacterium]|nr:tetratricopeptide repeat protein [Vicinamibacterales bacterium]
IGSGLAETITADLRSLFGLGVVSRVRVAQALQALSARDLAAAGDRLAVELGRRLGAAWIVTGAYQRVGDQLRITAHFVDVRTGALVRTVKVDGRVDQIFALQDRIVFELTRGLDVRLGPEQVAAVARVETRSIAAYECYSRGMMNLRLGTLDSLDRAIVLLERATTLDPQYVAAWTGLAAAYSLKGEFLRLPELCERAIEHARRALALDPRHATAHGRLGDALLNLGRVDEAIAALEHALAIEPDNVFTLGVLARALWIGQGRIEEALERFERVVALNPEAGYAYLQMALLYSLRGRYDRAEAAARRAVDLQERLLSGHEGLQLVGARARLGYVFYLQGRYDEAVAEYERELAFLATSDHLLRDRTRIEVMQKLGAAWLRAGRPDEAARWFDQAVRAFDERIAKGADDPYTRYYMACLHALRGEEAEAIAHLERSIAEGGPVQRVRAARDPDLEAIRQAPAVQALLAA